jgi:ubiquinone/menaquinone biosynthesis C-methylase UbiE
MNATDITCTENVPSYLYQTYHWAYLNQDTLPWLDRGWVVSAILWGNAGRLMRDAIDEFSAGQQVAQAACVYGDFSRMLARRVGRSGALEVIDAAEIQLANARRKLTDQLQVCMRRADLAASGSVDANSRDGICCFFLLHEVPEQARCCIIENLLAAVKPGGKVVFVDYHRPHGLHPLRPVMSMVFRWLEPYAQSLFDSEIQARAARAEDFEWKKTVYFGGLYQKVVGVRRR